MASSDEEVKVEISSMEQDLEAMRMREMIGVIMKLLFLSVCVCVCVSGLSVKSLGSKEGKGRTGHGSPRDQ